MKIPESTYNAIMGNALSAFTRENWLIEASDMRDAGLGEVAEIMEGFFAPFCDRLIAQSTELKPENVQKARALYFAKFTALATGEEGGAL